MHETYEQLSKEMGWETQDKCKVGFDDLPNKNKIVMLGVADAVIKRFNESITITNFPESKLPEHKKGPLMRMAQ